MNFFEKRLSTRTAQPFSVSAKIRVGTKAISKAAAKNAVASKYYKLATEGKISFQEAEKKIAQEADIKNPFYPRNTREFHAHPWDMGPGGQAVTDKLLQLYGEMKEGDTSPKLYTFPIVFPEIGGKIESVIQGGMRVAGGGPNTIRYWSEFNETGQQVCKHLPEVMKSEHAQRGRGNRQVRHTERKPVLRGLCNPEECNEYALGMCRFDGVLRFYIPGIAGAGVFELHTGSTLAATEIYRRIIEAFRAMGNNIINYTPDGRPVFYLSKRKETRRFFDEEGNGKVGEQWVPHLEVNIEMPKVIMIQQARAMGLDFEQSVGNSQPAQGQVLAMPNSWQQTHEVGSLVMSQEAQSVPGEVRADAAHAAAKPAEANEVVDEPATAVQKSQPVTEVSGANADASQDDSSSLESPEDVMIRHAQANRYEQELKNWVKAKFNGDFPNAYESWASLLSRYGAFTSAYVKLAHYIHEMGLNGELVLNYLKAKYGPMGNGSKLEMWLAHMRELCADGAPVAMSIMEEFMEDMTAQSPKVANG